MAGHTGVFHSEASAADGTGRCLAYLHTAAQAERPLDCDQAALLSLYGPPKDSAKDVTAVIATIPDPLHTRLSVEIDRFLDALQQAAYRSNWELATQWLPWTLKAATGTAKTGAAVPDVDLESCPG